MVIRTLSAIVMATFALVIIFLGSPYFETFILFVGLLGIIEWYRLVLFNNLKISNIIIMLVGFFYILSPCLILIWLRNHGEYGLYFVIWFFVVIWATDIGAYLVGRTIGGAKLAPRISPNKTWSGFIGGLFIALISSLLLDLFFSLTINFLILTLGCILLSIVGQIGDLFESWCKRRLGVKDTGTLIPGHGGILDRVDSILLSAPVAGFVAFIFQNHEISWK